MTTGRLEFRILGPLAVQLDGRPLPIGGPKQRALLALLLLSANRVVSRERLTAELFAEQSVNSADHALRNHVSRLRKVLAPAAPDEPRLVARAPGYLLRVEPGELDLERFERLVAAGRESLAEGDAVAAAESLLAAERLWHGRPLADLELEPFGRLDVERLEELRLAAVEERIDAQLALGGQRPLVAELEALAAEHPYRERFRAQLMLALYRGGRQAEGLEVYRKTRVLLHDELGLEPGAELQDLERAILVQDPALVPTGNGATRARPPSGACPFKGLAPFEAEDADLFFGRERLVEELVGRLADTSLLALVGPSGSGKSSLLRAGLLPALGGEAVVLRPGEHPGEALGAALARLPPEQRAVLAVDQLEEVFAPAVGEAERRAFVEALVEAVWEPERRTLVLLALRADFFGRLAPYGGLADLIGASQVLLGPLTRTELRRAIEGPAARAGLEVEQRLVDALVDDVPGEAGGLPLLSTALVDVWRERDGATLTLEAYERTGGVRGAVAHHAETAFRSLDGDGQAAARRVLLRLVAGGGGEALTRRRATRDELDADDELVAGVLAALVERRLIVAAGDGVELVHEALLERWPRLAEWVEEDVQGRRLHRHLAHAAAEWETAGRDTGELYRGARLAAALEWADAAGDEAGLNLRERAFLEESRTAFTRANRRLRVLLAVVLVLLVAAVAAGAVALAARASAKRQATAAIAQRLGSQALVEPQLDRSLLLAREGIELDDSPATRSNLLAALLRSPAALSVLHGSGTRVLDDALDRTGRRLAVRSDDGRVAFFDTRTGRRLGPGYAGSGEISHFGAIVRPVRALSFSPDGRTLAVGDSDGWHATLALLDTATHAERATVTDAKTGVTADVVFAPDGRTIVTGEAVDGVKQPPDHVLVLRRAADGEELRRSAPIAGGRLIGYTADGRSLLETSGETTSYLLDARTLRRVRTLRAGGSAALAPMEPTAAFGRPDGSVELVDVSTGARRPMDRRAPGNVVALAFSRDGRLLATGSDDGTVEVWDVATATLRDTFRGHAGEARGLLFGRDGSTLVSGSSDGSVIVWDVDGGRRLARPFAFSPRAASGAGVLAAGASAATAVAASSDGARFVTPRAPGRVTVWRARDLRPVGELRGPTGPINSLVLGHDGRLVAATGDGRTTVVWDVATGRIVRRLGPAGKGGASGVALSPDDSRVATAGADGTLRIYDLRTGELVGHADARGSLQDVDFSSDGRRLAGAGLSGEIVVWSVVANRVERIITQGDLIASVRFSPDGARIATGDSAGNVEFWDPATGRRVGRTLAAHNGWVTSVTYDPSGAHVVTTSSDGRLRLWDVASGKLVGEPLPAAESGGWGTVFPDGRHAIAVFPSGMGVAWTIDPAAWKAQACRIAHRNLTRAEWRDFLPERPYARACG
jgi:WD40 repeat protein/DNA-binding SARP family transcriptional activator